MTSQARLVGFIRRMPDVYTFATPVFADENGARVAQIESQGGGKVASFHAVEVGRGFAPLDFDFAARVGGPLLYGFEVSDSAIVLGHARTLASYLRKGLEASLHFRNAKPRTTAAIERFIESTASSNESADDSYLFELMRPADESTYVLRGAVLDPARVVNKSVPRNRTQWRDELLRSAAADHSKFFDGHKVAIRRIEVLAQASGLVASGRRAIEKELADVLAQCRIENGQLVYERDKPICHHCLFHFFSRYPTQASLEKLLDFEAAPSKLWEKVDEADLDIQRDALEAMHRFLTRRDSSMKIDEAELRHIGSLRQLDKNMRATPRTRQMLNEFEALRRLTQSKKHVATVEEWQQGNKDFGPIVDAAVKYGEQMGMARY